MQTTKKKSLRVILSLVALMLAALLLLSSCQKEEQPGDDVLSSAEGGGQPAAQGETPKETLSVSYDENFVYDPESVADIFNALNVEIVSDGVRRKAAFSIKSSTLSDDGAYVELVIFAEGLEQTVRLPYAGKSAPVIRAELLPLYEALKKEGDRFFGIKLSGSVFSDADDTGHAVDLDIAVNLPEAGGTQFALIRENGEAPEVLAVYKDGTLSVCGITVDEAKLQALLDDLAGKFPIFSDEEDEAEETTAPSDPEELFVLLSGVLDACDRVFANPLVKTMRLPFSAQDGVYSLDLNSKKMVALAQLLSGGEFDGAFDLNQLIDFLDAQFDGAVKAGDLDFHLSFAVKEDGIALNFAAENKKSDASFAFAVSFTAAKEAFDIPELSDTVMPELPDEPIFDIVKENLSDILAAILADTATDLEITVPVVLPQKNLELTVKTVLHLSDLILGEGQDIITTRVFYNEQETPIISFVLNDAYMYLDMNGWASLVFQGGMTDPVTFYYAFEADGEPASLKEVVLQLLLGQIGGDLPMEEDEGWDATEENEEDEQGYTSWGWSTKENADLIFDVGAEEEELRSRLIVVVSDGNGEDVQTEEYRIEGFDGSTSYTGEVEIVLSDGNRMSVEIVIRNPATAMELERSFDKVYVKKGDDCKTVQAYITATRTFFDGKIFWQEPIGDFTVCAVDGVPATENTVFDTAGELTLTVTGQDGAKEYTVSAYVYDPQNLIPLSMNCNETIYLESKKASDDEIREQLYVTVEFDSRDSEEVKDYEILRREDDKDAIFVKWNEFEQRVAVEYAETAPTLTEYLRFYESDEEEEESDAIIRSIFNALKIFWENKEALDSVFTVSETDAGNTRRVVINTEGDQDLLAFLNLFVGIPGEDGWTDIDENTVSALLDAWGAEKLGMMVDMRGLFQKVTGVELEEFLTELYADVYMPAGEEGFEIGIALGDGNETTYMETGLQAKFVSPAEPFVLTEEQIKTARGFEYLKGYVLMLLLPALM